MNLNTQNNWSKKQIESQIEKSIDTDFDSSKNNDQ